MSEDRSARNLLVEGVVIVASILLAFAIDAWWDDRREAAERDRILGQLRKELALYQEIVPQAIESSERAAGASELLLRVIHGSESATPAELHTAIGDVGRAFEFGAAAPVFELLAGAGGFSLVTDPELRQAISDITAFISLTRQFEDIEGNSLQAWKRHLGDHYDRYGGGKANGYLGEDFPRSRFTEDFAFLQTRTVSNLLYERRARARAVNRFRSQVLEHTEIAIDIIDRATDD